jgi:hypothetical protein
MSKWINLADEGPCMGDTVLVYNEDMSEVCIAYTSRHEPSRAKVFKNDKDEILWGARFWMPLPEPPQ